MDTGLSGISRTILLHSSSGAIQRLQKFAQPPLSLAVGTLQRGQRDDLPSGSRARARRERAGRAAPGVARRVSDITSRRHGRTVGDPVHVSTILERNCRRSNHASHLRHFTPIPVAVQI